MAKHHEFRVTVFEWMTIGRALSPRKKYEPLKPPKRFRLRYLQKMAVRRADYFEEDDSIGHVAYWVQRGLPANVGRMVK